MIHGYRLEFILHTFGGTAVSLTHALSEFGEHLDICESAVEGSKGKHFTVCILAQDPTVVFDICGQFGRIKSVKIEEIK